MSLKDNNGPMAEQNSQIVKRTQKILSDQGYDVKLSHVYELYSKLGGVKDWNSAKALKKDFSEIISQLKGDDNLLWLGVKENKQPNLKKLSNILFAGDPSEGPILMIKHSIASIIEKKENVLAIYFSENRISKKINYNSRYLVRPLEEISKYIQILESEMKRRFSLDENKINKEPIILIGIESFSEVIDEIKYHFEVDRSGTIAYKLKQLLRNGKKYGIYFLIQADDRLSVDIPKSLKIYLDYDLKFFDKNKTIDSVGQVLDFSMISEESILDKINQEKSNSSCNWKVLETKHKSVNELIHPIDILKALNYEVIIQENKAYPISYIIKTKNKKIGIHHMIKDNEVPKTTIPFLSLAKKHLSLDELWLLNSYNKYINGNQPNDSKNEYVRDNFDKMFFIDDIKNSLNILSGLDQLTNDQQKELLDLIPFKVD